MKELVNIIFDSSYSVNFFAIDRTNLIGIEVLERIILI